MALVLREEASDGRTRDIAYTLKSVVMHAGRTVYAGHYVARVQWGPRHWKHLEDDVPAKAHETLFAKLDKAFSPYLLFYQRSD